MLEGKKQYIYALLGGALLVELERTGALGRGFLADLARRSGQPTAALIALLGIIAVSWWKPRGAWRSILLGVIAAGFAEFWKARRGSQVAGMGALETEDDDPRGELHLEDQRPLLNAGRLRQLADEEAQSVPEAY